jgi:hypothetical protein
LHSSFGIVAHGYDKGHGRRLLTDQK